MRIAYYFYRPPLLVLQDTLHVVQCRAPVEIYRICITYVMLVLPVAVVHCHHH